MSWLTRLKEAKGKGRDATKTTETDFVVSVAPCQAPLQIKSGKTGPTTETTSTALSPALHASFEVEGQPAWLESGDYPWPYSTGMNNAESGLFASRVRHFTAKGFSVVESESIADQLLTRDRDSDGRRYCLECRYLSGFGPSNWRCENSICAERATQQRKTALSNDLALQLQHCAGFDYHPLDTHKVRAI